MKRMSMNKKLIIVSIIIVIAFCIRSVLYFVGESNSPSSENELFLGNGTLVDIGNQLFYIICFLSVCYVAVTLINNVKDELFKNIGNYPYMREVWQEWENEESVTEMSTGYLDYLINFEEANRKQCNYLFFAAIVAFAAGIVLIGGGTVFAYIKMGNILMIFLVLSGIISELISICFGYMANRLMKQADKVYKLVNKKTELSLLMEKAEEQGNKEEMLLSIFEKTLDSLEVNGREGQLFFK